MQQPLNLLDPLLQNQVSESLYKGILTQRENCLKLKVDKGE